jgi:hypothetical protein
MAEAKVSGQRVTAPKFLYFGIINNGTGLDWEHRCIEKVIKLARSAFECRKKIKKPCRT